MRCYILGLDPGSTIGYALLDLDGNLIVVDSFKGTLNEAIEKITSYGRVVIIGTDVCKVSKAVDRIATLTGANIVYPDRDLLFYDKRKKTKEYLKLKNTKLKDKHQMDALASALFAYKHYCNLFNRINNEYDSEVSENIKREILINNLPIKKAKQNIEKNLV